MQIIFEHNPDYELIDNDIKVYNGNNLLTVTEVSDTVDVHLPSGDVIAINADGRIDFWTEGGQTLRFRSKLTGAGLSVLPADC